MASGSKLAAPLTESEMTTAISLPKLVTGATIWQPKANQAWAHAEWQLHHDLGGVKLRLLANINLRDPEKFATSVLWNDIRVAGVCVRTPHSNKHTDDRRFLWDSHEHVWTDACNATWCRQMTETPDSVKSAVSVLCTSFGVTFQADWQDPPSTYQEGFTQL